MRVLRQPTPPPQPRVDPLVLVVEDHADHAEALSLMLEADGFRVEVAPQAEAALAALAKGLRPGVVLLDLTLPGMGGLDLLARLRRERPGLPLVVMTGLAREPVPGAQATLAKPLDYERLRATLTELTRPSK